MRLLVIILFSLLGSVLALFVVMGYVLSAPKYRGPVSDHFNGKKFTNLGGVQAKGFLDVLKWATNRQQGPWFEVQALSGEKPATSIEDGLRITFVNHSTFLIQLHGLNILTDPVWGERVSPFSFMGPRRMRPPGIGFEDLPPIHAVLISHNHYDHLDLPTMKRLTEEYQPIIITPLGVGRFLEKKTGGKVQDMDWWENRALSDSVQVHSVPAQHFSGRGMSDRDATLWCGYVLKYPDGHLYFAGDTGYGPFVHEIAGRFQPMDVSLLPIGAYLPTWFMSPIHTSPADAAQMHMDLKSAKSIGIHFGTFPLADDGMNQPQEDLEAALEDLKIPRGDFITLPEGESVEIGGGKK